MAPIPAEILKVCRKCKVEKSPSDFYGHMRSPDRLAYWCKDCSNKRSNERFKIAYHKNPEKYRERSRKWIKDNPEKWRQGHIKSGKKMREILRKDVLMAYSKGKMVCACCGESTYQFLALDHVNGGGRKERDEHKGKVFAWLRKNNYPSGYQVLCHNCNSAKGYYGKCPHAANK